MRKAAFFALALTLAAGPATAHAQDQRPPGQRPAAAQDRRAELEEQVRRQFLAQVSERLALTPAQQTRMEQLLRSGAAARRQLAMESRQLRGDLMTAARTEGTPMSDFEGILARLNQLRDREHALERREAAALAEFLDPRQQALFLAMRMQLNERVRGMQGRPEQRPPRRRPPGN